MAFSINAMFDNNDAVRVLSAIGSRIGSIKDREEKYVKALSARVVRDVEQHFRDESDEHGHWTAWSDAYDAHMKRIGKGGNKILQNSGRLKNSFKPQHWRKGSGTIIWYNNAQTKGGFPYAAAHNVGGPKLPQRKFMWVSESAMKDISAITARFIMSGDV